MSLLEDVTAYARAALPLVPGASRLPWVAGGGGDMPELVRERETPTDRDRLAHYARVCGLRVRDEVPATWPHVLAFPLHMSLMADGRFPLPAVGLVHIANRIEQLRPIRVADTMRLTATTGPILPHPKGRSFTITTEARVGGDVAWAEVSTFLRRGRPAEGDGGAAEKDRVREVKAEPSATWHLPGDLGRRYASVSGDRNPIHLSDLTAKAFGFERAIAHGMWTAARSLAALEGRLPDAYSVDVRFRAPILLPATVGFATEKAGRGGRSTRFAVRDLRKGTPHLDGVLEPIRSTR
jgi:acyl dehydratase